MSSCAQHIFDSEKWALVCEPGSLRLLARFGHSSEPVYGNKCKICGGLRFRWMRKRLEMEMQDFGFNGKYILDEQGNPMPEPDLMKWAIWMEGKFRRVGSTDLGFCKVSTVFLGLDHNFHPMTNPLTYRPVLWETMVFGGPLDKEQRRYSSREEAIEGHAEVVKECMAAAATK